MNIPSQLGQKQKKTIFKILHIFTILSFFVAAGAIYQHLKFQRESFEKANSDLQSLTIKATQDIEAIFRKAMIKVNATADKLSTGKINGAEIQEQIRSLILENPNYHGSSITYPPYGYDTTKRLYAPYFHRVIGDSSKLELAQIEHSYDYTEPDYDWFVRPMKEGRSCFGKPYSDPVGETYMITYSSIFYDPDFNSGNKNSLLYCPILRV